MKKIWRSLGIAMAATLAATALYGQSTAAGTKADADLSKKVRHELLMLSYYTLFDNLAYRVDGNTVTLYGAVVRPVLKSDAERAVKRIEGVGQVIDQIEVLPLSPFDNRIRVAEYRAIFHYGAMSRYTMGVHPSLHIIVDNGHVTLEGVVSSQADKNIAGLRANGVPGVFSVTNNLVVGD